MSEVVFLFMVLFLTTSCQSSPAKAEQVNQAAELSPKLTKPVVRKIRIPETISDDGNMIDEAHWRFILERNSTWSQ